MIPGICVAGTGTDVGKTVISGALCSLLRKKGWKAGYFKPVLSGAHSEKGKLIRGIPASSVRWQISGNPGKSLPPCMYENPLSPHLAARLEGLPVDLEKTLRVFQELGKDYSFLVVEAAGGLVVPLNDEGFLMVDLLKMFRLPGVSGSSCGVGRHQPGSSFAEYARNRGFSLGGISPQFWRGEFS